MAFKPIPITWHGYLAGLAAVMAGVAVFQRKWTSVLIEAAMCVFFFFREARIQRARRTSAGGPDSL
jgi:4-hydroxybenzoate polyprenyltransferase